MSRKLLESSDLKEMSRHFVKECRAPKRGVSTDAKRREPLPRARELAGPPPLRTAASAPTRFAGEADAEATELQGGGGRELWVPWFGRTRCRKRGPLSSSFFEETQRNFKKVLDGFCGSK